MTIHNFNLYFEKIPKESISIYFFRDIDRNQALMSDKILDNLRGRNLFCSNLFTVLSHQSYEQLILLTSHYLFHKANVTNSEWIKLYKRRHLRISFSELAPAAPNACSPAKTSFLNMVTENMHA